MDSSEDNPTWTLESLKTSIDEASQAMQVTTQLSEMLATNLSNLTLNPSVKLPYLPEYPCQPTGQLPSEKTPNRRRGSDSQRELQQQEDTKIRSRVRRFQCTCSYCQFKRNPSDDTFESYYNTTFSNYAMESNES